jgi:hypothetical protein
MATEAFTVTPISKQCHEYESQSLRNSGDRLLNRKSYHNA